MRIRIGKKIRVLEHHLRHSKGLGPQRPLNNIEDPQRVIQHIEKRPRVNRKPQVAQLRVAAGSRTQRQEDIRGEEITHQVTKEKGHPVPIIVTATHGPLGLSRGSLSPLQSLLRQEQVRNPRHSHCQKRAQILYQSGQVCSRRMQLHQLAIKNGRR